MHTFVKLRYYVGNGGKYRDLMENHFFSGSSDGKLDEKNRFVLSQEMRYGLVEDGKLEFTLGLGAGGCLAIYRRSDIKKMVEKFKENLYLASQHKFFTLFFSTLFHTTCDKIGRVIIPHRLKDAVAIKKEIVIAGVLDKIEIWPKETYDSLLKDFLTGKDKEFNLAKMTEDAFALLNEKKIEQ